MAKIIVIYTLLTFICGQAIADDWKNKKKKYLCTSQASGGVTYSKALKTWVGARFTINTKYIVDIDHSKLSEYDQKLAKIFELPNDFPTFGCTYKDYSDPLYQCENFDGEFIFNEKTLRFQFSSLTGFLGGSNLEEYPSFIVIGKCKLI